MNSQISWFIQNHIIDVSVESVLRGYAADQLAQNLTAFINENIQEDSRFHLIIDISQMQVSHSNAELLYNTITPLMINQQIRWIILYGGNADLQGIFKEIMFDLFRNPCVVLENRDTALDFIYRKDRHLPGLVQQAS